MPPAEFPPPCSQTLTGNLESLVALAGAQTSMNRLKAWLGNEALYEDSDIARCVPVFGLSRLISDKKYAKLWAGRGGRGGVTDPVEGLVIGLRRCKAKIANWRDCVRYGEKVVHGGKRASPTANGAIYDLDLGCCKPGVGLS